MSDHKYIYLEPECCGEDSPYGRCWCEDPMGNCELGVPDTKYIRHDLYEQIQATNQLLLEQLERVYRELPDAHIYLGMGESEPLKDSFDFQPIAEAITNAKQRGE
jgi:hypothetical protein